MAIRVTKNLYSLVLRAGVVGERSLSTSSKILGAGIDDKLFGLNPDQENFRQTVHEFCKKNLAPFADQIDKNNGWSELG